MRFPLPAGPEMVQVIKSNSLGGGKASDSRKQERCVTSKKKKNIKGQQRRRTVPTVYRQGALFQHSAGNRPAGFVAS